MEAKRLALVAAIGAIALALIALLRHQWGLEPDPDAGPVAVIDATRLADATAMDATAPDAPALADAADPVPVDAASAIDAMEPPPPSGGCEGASGELTADAPRPRIWWTADRLERARRWVDATGWAPPSSPWAGDHYIDLAFAYIVAGDLDAGRRAVDWAMNLRLDVTRPGDDARWYGEAAVLVYDWCHDLMSPEDRSAFVTRWNGYISGFNAHQWGGPHMPQSNYFWGFFRNGLLWSVTSYGENPRAEELLDHALDVRWRALREYTEAGVAPNVRKHGTFQVGGDVPGYYVGEGAGGVPIEGTQYGPYMLGYSVTPAATMACYGRPLYGETEFFRDAVYWATFNYPGPTTRGGTSRADMFPFADDEGWMGGHSARHLGLGDFLTTVAMSWPDATVGRIARSYLDTVRPARRAFVAASDPGGASLARDSIPLDYYAPGPSFLWSRSGWGNDATALMVQGYTRPDGHEHYDAGTFQLWRGGRWLSRETVSYTHQIVGHRGVGRVDGGRTIGHNGMVFGAAGQGQISPVYRRGPARILRLGGDAHYAYMASDLTDTYAAVDRPQVHNPHVTSHVREVLFLRDLEVVLVIDRYRLATPDTVATWLAHFEAPPAVSPGRALYTSGDQQLDVRTLYPAVTAQRVIDEDAQLSGRSSDAGQYRYEVEAPGSGTMVHALAAGDAGSSASVELSETDVALAVSVSFGNASTTVTILKGAQSAGGLVGGTPLPAGVTPGWGR